MNIYKYPNTYERCNIYNLKFKTFRIGNNSLANTELKSAKHFSNNSYEKLNKSQDKFFSSNIVFPTTIRPNQSTIFLQNHENISSRKYDLHESYTRDVISENSCIYLSTRTIISRLLKLEDGYRSN